MFSEIVKNRLDAINADLPKHLIFGEPRENGPKRNRLPYSVSFDGNDINQIDFDDDVRDILTSVNSLHLNNNSITSWTEVMNLLKNMLGLLSLNLSTNPLQEYEDISSILSADFQYLSLKSLILNETNLTWKMTIQILKLFPNLEEIHLCKNRSLNDFTNYSYLLNSNNGDDDTLCFGNIRQLFYNCNECDDLRLLILIGILFPKLENLICLDNQFHSLITVSNYDGDQPSLHRYFPKLISLNLSENQITDWESIEYLEKFELLKELRISTQPLFKDMDQNEVWNGIVARLDNLTKLNGSKITGEMRIDAERAFIRYYWNEEIKPSKFHQLKTLHPDVQPLVNIDFCRGSYESPQYRVYKVMSSNKTTKIKIDVYKTTIGQLKSRICQMLNIQAPVNNCRLLLWSLSLGISSPMEMVEDKALLHLYKVLEDECSFSIEIINDDYNKSADDAVKESVIEDSSRESQQESPRIRVCKVCCCGKTFQVELDVCKTTVGDLKSRVCEMAGLSGPLSNFQLFLWSYSFGDGPQELKPTNRLLQSYRVLDEECWLSMEETNLTTGQHNDHEHRFY